MIFLDNCKLNMLKSLKIKSEDERQDLIMEPIERCCLVKSIGKVFKLSLSELQSEIIVRCAGTSRYRRGKCLLAEKIYKWSK